MTAAVFRAFDAMFQNVAFVSCSAVVAYKTFRLLVVARPGTADMEANSYFCTALASGLIALRRIDKARSSSVLPGLVTVLSSVCESEFTQVHCAAGASLKRILSCVFMDPGFATSISSKEEHVFITQLLANMLSFYQLKLQPAWMYVLDATRALLDAFRAPQMHSQLQLVTGVIKKVADIYQAIELSVLEVDAVLHISLESTLGAALRACGLQDFLYIVPLQQDGDGGAAAAVAATSTGEEIISTSREWVLRLLQSNLKLMTCELAEFGRCILPLANSYYQRVKALRADNASTSTSSSSSSSSGGGDGGGGVKGREKLLRTRIAQLWALLPELCQHQVRDIPNSFPRLASIMERIFADTDYPELIPLVVRSLLHLARGVLDRYSHLGAAASRNTGGGSGGAGAGAVAAAADKIPEVRTLRESCFTFLPLLLQYLEGLGIGDAHFQEGVQCVSAWSCIAPVQLVEAISKKLLQLVLTSTTITATAGISSGGMDSTEGATAAAGWMSVMMAIIPQLPRHLVVLLFKAVRPLLQAAEASSVQKRAYSLLVALLHAHRTIILQHEPPLQIIKAVSESLLTCHVSARTMRFRALEALMTSRRSGSSNADDEEEEVEEDGHEQDGAEILDLQQLQQVMEMILEELLASLKDPNKKSRDAALDILRFFIRRLPPTLLWEPLENKLQQMDTPSVSSTSAAGGRSAALTALCLLILSNRADPDILLAARRLLPLVCLLVEEDEASAHPHPHQTKAVLSFLRVFVAVQPVHVFMIAQKEGEGDGEQEQEQEQGMEVEAGDHSRTAASEILQRVVWTFTQALGANKAKFSSRCRAIMRKLLQRVGEPALRETVPSGDVALLDYVCKQGRRADRKRTLKDKQMQRDREQSRVDRMLGSDSEDDEDDDDDDKIKESGPNQGQGQEQSAFSRRLAHIAAAARHGIGSGGLTQREDYRLGRRPRATRAADSQLSLSAALPSTLDDLLDDQPSALQQQRNISVRAAAAAATGSTGAGGAREGPQSKAGKKRGRGGEEDGLSAGVASMGMQSFGNTVSRRETDLEAGDGDGFSVVVTKDGMVVVKEQEQDTMSLYPNQPGGKGSRKRHGGSGSGDGGSGEAYAEGGGTADPAAHTDQSAAWARSKATTEDGQRKRRKLTLKEPGVEYRPKKGTGGDVWKKGMLEPHAYIPLDPRLLSKKHREQAVSHFGAVVGNKRGGGGKKGAKGQSKQTLPSGRGSKSARRLGGKRR